MNNFIKIYDDALPSEVCDDMIDLYKSNPNLHEFKYEVGKNFNQFAFTNHQNLNMTLYSKILETISNSVNLYKSEIPETHYWPNEYVFEEIRIKCYNPENKQRFEKHVDSFNLLSSSRILAFLFYLNDVDKGGITEFMNLNFKVKPKKGRLLMFPPHWMYPHRGCPPVSNTKYICGSFIRFTS
jgi:hypothetical protein